MSESASQQQPEARASPPPARVPLTLSGQTIAIVGIEIRRAGIGWSAAYLHAALGESALGDHLPAFYGEAASEILCGRRHGELRLGLAEGRPAPAVPDQREIARHRRGEDRSLDVLAALEWCAAGFAAAEFDLAIMAGAAGEEAAPTTEFLIALAPLSGAQKVRMPILGLLVAGSAPVPAAFVAAAGLDRPSIESGLRGTLTSHPSGPPYRGLWAGEQAPDSAGAALENIVLATLSLACRRIPPSRMIGTWPGAPELGFGRFQRQRPWLQPRERGPRTALALVGAGARVGALAIHEADPRAPDPVRLNWTSRLFVLSGMDSEELQGEMDRLAGRLAEEPGIDPRSLAAELWKRPHRAIRCAIVACDIADLAARLGLAGKRLGKPVRRAASPNERVFIGRSQFASQPIALTVPGLGSPYPGMLRELACVFPHVRRLFESLSIVFEDEGDMLLAYLFPADDAPGVGLQSGADRFWSRFGTATAAGCIASKAMFDIYRGFNLRHAMLVGHSIGESLALVLAGRLGPPLANPLPAMAQAIATLESELSAMTGYAPTAGLAVACPERNILDEAIAPYAGRIFFSLENCPHQTVIAGESAALAAVASALRAQGINCVPMVFPVAFHTPLMTPGLPVLDRYYAGLGFRRSDMPVWSGAANAPFPGDPALVSALARRPWAETLDFGAIVSAVHERGFRLLVDLGPSETVSGFVEDILNGRDHLALSGDSRWFGGLQHLLAMLGQLYVAGVDLGPVLEETNIGEAEEPAAAPVAAGAEGPPTLHPNAAAAVLKNHFALMNEFIEQQTRVLALALAHAGADGTPAPANARRLQAAPAGAPFPALGPATDLGGGKIAFERRLSVESDPYLADHVFGRIDPRIAGGLTGLPVVPFVATLETMCQAALAARQDKDGPWVVAGAERLRLHRWLALDPGYLDIRVIVQAADMPKARLDAQRLFLAVEIFEIDESAPAGQWLAADSIVELARDYDAAPTTLALPGAPYALRATMKQFEEVGIFQGPSFRSLVNFPRATERGIEAEIVVPRRDRLYAGEADPAIATGFNLLDATGQTVARWVIEFWKHNFGIFPSKIESFRQYGPPPAPGEILRATGIVELQDDIATADFEFRRPEGDVLYRYRGFTHRRFDWTVEMAVCLFPYEGGLNSGFSERLSLPVSGLIGCRIDGRHHGFVDRNHAIFMQSVAHCVLNAQERRVWRQLPKAGPRRALWLMGRIAAKEAVQLWLRERHEIHVHSLAIEILTDELGKPFARLDPGIADLAVPNLSISHADSAAIAMIAEQSGTAVGVDLEEPRAGQPQAAPERAFSAGEIRIARERGISLIDLWCAKEAAAKALGIGLLGEPRRWQVEFIGPSSDRIAVLFEGVRVPVTAFRLYGASVAIAQVPQAAADQAKHQAMQAVPVG
jgi:malonyl CoA-acyl carrier protein transacylase/phosphopantetheinyl transferase (holo-ACP synthase)